MANNTNLPKTQTTITASRPGTSIIITPGANNAAIYNNVQFIPTGTTTFVGGGSGYITYGFTGPTYNPAMYEPGIEHNTKELLYVKHMNGDDGIRSYIIKYIADYKVFVNLRAAIKDVSPNHEAMIDKLVPLKR